MEEIKEKSKMEREVRVFLMGMIDSYDYISGKHPGLPDDERPIEQWADILKSTSY